LPAEKRVRIYTKTITVGALLKWAGIVATGGAAKALIASRRVLVNGVPEVHRGRRVTVGDLVAIQGGPTLVVEEAADAPPPPPVAPRLP
jgi:ribosome-associated protein